MRKIPSVFKRQHEGGGKHGENPVVPEVVPGCEWVLAGEGIATRKWDGTCAMFAGGRLFKRYDAKHGKTPPSDFQPAQEPDPATGHWPGWLPVSKSKPEDKWFFDASWPTVDGTYELCGPKIGGNAEGFETHRFIQHGADVLDLVPRTFDGMCGYLANFTIEGIVFHHPDGRWAKIKRRDFLLAWPVRGLGAK